MKVFLIRHGETTGDVEDRYGGHYDDHMTPDGHKQVEEAARKLVGKGVEILFSSPLIRAREASAILQEVLHCPVEIVDGLKERNIGILAGMIKSEAAEKYPDIAARYPDRNYTCPEGETYQASYDRVIAAFRQIISLPYASVGILTHGGPIRYLHRELGKGEIGELGHGAVFEFDL